MSVEDRRIVDIVSCTPDGNCVTLTVVDHLEWNVANKHLLALQEKLNNYMMFIESGEIFENYPQADGKTIAINVVCTHPPCGDAIRFLELAKEKIEEAGVAFSWGPLTE